MIYDRGIHPTFWPIEYLGYLKVQSSTETSLRKCFLWICFDEFVRYGVTQRTNTESHIVSILLYNELRITAEHPFIQPSKRKMNYRVLNHFISVSSCHVATLAPGVLVPAHCTEGSKQTLNNKCRCQLYGCVQQMTNQLALFPRRYDYVVLSRSSRCVCIIWVVGV